MKKYFLILFFLNVVLVFAQDTIKTDGYVVFKYENGKISSEGIIKEKKPDGYWKTYYENGKLKSKGNRKNFELDSTWKFYNEEGKLILEINYKKGKKNGIKSTYFEKEIVRENFVNDIKEGYTSYYYTDGKIRLTINFIKGREQGMAKEYSPKGTVITLLEYKNGYLVGKEKVNRYNTDSLKQGKWVSFYPNGNIQSEAYYMAGIKSGYFKEYSQDGNLLSVVKYINGELQKDAEEVAKLDIKTEYYPNGAFKRVGSYKNNISEGITREYSLDGKIDSAKVYKNGVIVGKGIVDEQGLKQGIWTEYYDAGELKDHGKYVNGLKIGDWKFYYMNGKIEQTGTYLKNEKPDGEWKWYYENTDLLRRDEVYSEGVENGTFIEYSDTGSIETKGEYMDGLEQGLWVYQLGDIKMEGSYKDGKRDGIWKYYLDNGNIYFTGVYIDDNPDGKHIIYWDNGKIMEEGYYVMGKREGEWYKYNYDGAIFLITTYNNGIETKYDGVKIKPPTIEDNSNN
jgi:antitoxin component YwqK of YwqJK toxin-antitoxin module